mmetsp:Transcript_72642/g.122266  ORF Transcript_72642/g.122266 Transcript_72642/m.122266 type:complete len:213 (-) Transcript_72642:1357-1995(-)
MPAKALQHMCHASVPLKFQWAHGHEMLNHFVRGLLAPLLVILEQRQYSVNQLLLDLPCQHPPRFVVVMDLLQLVIILQKEPEVLVWDVDVGVATVCLVLLLRSAAATEGVLGHLLLDVLFCVGQENGAVGVGGAHFGGGAQQTGKELGMDERWFEEPQLRGYIAGHPEIRILVDGLGDETEHVFVGGEDVGERRGERGSGLHRRERPLADVV